jgi:hypothetical protein
MGYDWLMVGLVVVLAVLLGAIVFIMLIVFGRR